MTFHEEVAALKARIAAGHAERDGWRACGMQEKYLEAYSRVEALELQLEGLRQEGLRTTARSEPPVQRDHPVPAAQGAHATEALQRELMAEFAISFRADAYHLGPYRYTMLDDAVKYARLLRMQGREADLTHGEPGP